MRLILPLLFLLSFKLNAQNPTISKNDIQKIYEEIAEESITRSNSLSINLSDLAFKIPTKDNYLPHLKIVFKQNEGGQSKIINEYRYLSDYSYTHNLKKGQLYSRNINHKNLVENQDLKNVTHIEITIELVKVSDPSDDIKNITSSLFGVALNTDKSLFGVDLVNNLIKATEETDTKRIVYQNEFEIPSNFYEYNELKNAGRNAPYISSNDKIAIILDTSIEDNGGTIINGIKNILNSVTKFTYGKKLIAKPTIEIDGALTLNFTKNRSKVLPEVVKDKIDALMVKIDNLDPSQIPDSPTGVKDFISREFTSVESDLKLLREADGITENQKKHLSLFVQLATIYFRKYVYNNSKNPVKVESSFFFHQYRKFKQQSRRSTNYAQLNYINDIYSKENSLINKKKDDKILSELFLFPSLSDEHNQASMDWQIYLDEYINEKMDKN